MLKYKFHVIPECKKVICITKYHGQTIRGIAKCCDNDTWDVEKGKNLAFQRCYLNFLTKQLKYLSSCESRAEGEYQQAKQERDRVIEIRNRVANDYIDCCSELITMEKEY